ncbi:MAG: anti-sigma factor [Aliiglaciecola sp.]
MNYLNENLRHVLAAEYVLGTLSIRARRRLEQLRVEHIEIERAIQDWEWHFNGLAEKLTPQPPSEVVWQRIEQTLLDRDINTQQNVVDFKAHSVRLWQSITGFATAAVLVLAFLLFSQPESLEPLPDQITVVQSENNQPLWLIEIFNTRIDTQATQNVVKETAKDYELWMVPKDGTAPISLGLLPQEGIRSLVKHNRFDTTEIAALAVSIEPLGGSVTGSPTQVLYISPLALL